MIVLLELLTALLEYIDLILQFVIFPARIYTIVQIFNLLCWHYAQWF